MWARKILDVRSCTRLTGLISQGRFGGFTCSSLQGPPQKVLTFARHMSKSEGPHRPPEPTAVPDTDRGQKKNVDTSTTQLTNRQRLSLIFAEYGVTAVVFHTAISLTSLGLCYAAVSSGLDVPAFLIKIGVSESASQSVAAKGASTFVIAYACHKVFMPVRIFLTVTCTPIIVHRLRRLGLIK